MKFDEIILFHIVVERKTSCFGGNSITALQLRWSTILCSFEQTFLRAARSTILLDLSNRCISVDVNNCNFDFNHFSIYMLFSPPLPHTASYANDPSCSLFTELDHMLLSKLNVIFNAFSSLTVNLIPNITLTLLKTTISWNMKLSDIVSSINWNNYLITP